jgi:type I restriction enzyme M protein
MIALPGQLFTNTQIPACIWFLTKNKKGGNGKVDRRGKTLFIDARQIGYMKDRVLRDFTKEDIAKIADTFHNWRAPWPPEGGNGVVERMDKRGVFEPSVLRSANPAMYAVLEQRAKEMRANPTEAEAVLWEKLRNKQLGIKFRQQHVIDNFIADFCSIEGCLIIEVDGDIHDDQKIADEKRTHILETYGYTVIRFKNDEVLNQTENVLNQISNLLKSPSGDLGARNPSGPPEPYEDQPGFCFSATIQDIEKHDFVLTPGRFVGAVEQEDDGVPFAEKMAELTAKLTEQFAESERLEKEIKKNLAGLGYEI